MTDKSRAPQPVLLVIDMLNDFLDKWPAARRHELCKSTNEMIGMMRNYRHPIVWVRQEFEPDLRDAFLEMKLKEIRITMKGTTGCEIVPELDFQPGDEILIKKRFSAFYGTSLDSLLEQLNPQTLILAGINTHACIRMTAIDAYQRDRKVILALDCVDSYDREHHEVSLRYMKDYIAEVMTNEELRHALSV
jgi:nicotinamidase-related amidase